MRKRGAVLAAGMLAALAAGLAAEEASAFSVSYDQRTTTGGQVMFSKVRIKDERFRIETEGGTASAVIVHNESGTYSYLPNGGMAMKLPALTAEQHPIEHAEDYAAYLRTLDARKIGAETVNGYPCDLYEFTDPAAGGRTKAWVWTDKQFPVKLEQHTKGGLVTTEITRLESNASIADDAFQLPPGIKVMDMGGVMDVGHLMGAGEGDDEE